ncbi:MAG: hypothetical protein JWP80_1005 [Pseudomonas sp.]|nr:hypothetical protein [Pseudomonas sp.]
MTTEIRLSREDFENDGSPEVLIEFHQKKKLQYVAYVASSKKNGVYDKVSGDSDVDSKKGHSAHDDKILIGLATAFMRIKL